MDKRLPENSESFDYDELAHDNLRAYFRIGAYVISKPATLFGNREFGKDWIIEILNKKRQNTGIEFFVQSKTTEAELKDTVISLDIDTKNINYLANKTVPVFIHLYHRASEKGYWIWFQDWYIRNYSPAWRIEQKTVTINIPVKQELTEVTVADIIHIVTNENYKARVRHAIDLFNSIDQNFHFSAPEFSGNDMITIASPKHENVQFNIVVDEKSNSAIQKALEEGFAVQFPVISTTAPSPLESVVMHEDNEVITLIPYNQPDQKYLNVSFTDASKEKIAEYKSVVVRRIRTGAKHVEYWSLPDEQTSLVFSLVFALVSNQPETLVQFRFFCLHKDNPIVAKSFYELYENMKRAKMVYIEGFGNEIKSIELDILPEVQTEVKRFITAMYNLKQTHGYDVKIPQEIDANALFCAEIANDILSNRKSFWVVDPKPTGWKSTLHEVNKMLKRLNEQSYVYVASQEVHELAINFAGVEISLGKVRSVFYVSNILNRETLESMMTTQEQNDDTTLLDLEIDMEKSFTVSE